MTLQVREVSEIDHRGGLNMHNASLPVRNTPFAGLSPPPTRYQLIWIVPLTPYVVLLDIRGMSFSITDPFLDLV